MIRKTLIATAFGLALAGSTAAPAHADIDIDIDIHLNYGGFYGRNISCRSGERILERRFNNVTARDCRGSRFDYTARRNGKWYIIGLSSATGRITSIRRWYR